MRVQKGQSLTVLHVLQYHVLHGGGFAGTGPTYYMCAGFPHGLTYPNRYLLAVAPAFADLQAGGQLLMLSRKR